MNAQQVLTQQEKMLTMTLQRSTIIEREEERTMRERQQYKYLRQMFKEFCGENRMRVEGHIPRDEGEEENKNEEGIMLRRIEELDIRHRQDKELKEQRTQEREEIEKRLNMSIKNSPQPLMNLTKELSAACLEIMAKDEYIEIQSKKIKRENGEPAKNPKLVTELRKSVQVLIQCRRNCQSTTMEVLLATEQRIALWEWPEEMRNKEIEWMKEIWRRIKDETEKREMNHPERKSHTLEAEMVEGTIQEPGRKIVDLFLEI